MITGALSGELSIAARATVPVPLPPGLDPCAAGSARIEKYLCLARAAAKRC